MSYTQKYRDQHVELLDFAKKISSHLTAAGIEQNADEISKQLNFLTGKLKMHLAIEDEFLYPNLKKNSDTNVQNMTEKFSQEMGGIAKAFMDYRAKWPTPSKMKENANDFIKDTEAVFKVLKDRIDRENNQLYALADKVCGSKAA